MTPSPAPASPSPTPSLVDGLAPEVASGVLTASLLVLAAAIAVLIGVMVWAHLARAGRSRRIARVLDPLRPRLLALAADLDESEDSADSTSPVTLTGFRARVVDRAVLDLLGKVRGGAATALVDVLDRHGTVDGAVRGTRSLWATTRARSAQILGATRRPAHSATLAGLLADRDRAVRSSAARALGVIGDATYADAVLRAVRETKGLPGIPFYVAADALLSMGGDVREAIRRGLDDTDPGVRFVATTVAARGGMASLLPRVVQLFRGDPDARVRAAAAQTLGAIGDGAVIDELARALAPTDPVRVRRAAAAALGELGAPEALELLRPMLSDPDRRLAEVAAGSLSSLGPRGEGVLVDALTSGSPPAEISARDPGSLPEADLAALAALGAVTAIGIRGRRPDLYELATTRRLAAEPARDEEPTP